MRSYEFVDRVLFGGGRVRVCIGIGYIILVTVKCRVWTFLSECHFGRRRFSVIIAVLCSVILGTSTVKRFGISF
jgi:hypothetical protein